jgi:acetyl-CoA acetyltransferase family protein
MAGLLAGLPDNRAGVHSQPPLRLGHDAVAMAARVIRGSEADLMDRRRLGEHEPRALRHGQGDQRLRPQRRDVRHDDRLALRQSEDEAGLWRRHDAEHGRECRAANSRSRARTRIPFAGAAARPRAAAAQANGRLAAEIVPGLDPARKGDPIVVDRDEHPRATSVEALRQLEADRPARRHLSPPAMPRASMTAPAALIVATEKRRRRNGLTPRARVVGAAVAGVPPTDHGHRPGAGLGEAARRLGLKVADMDVIELNEAFAAQGLAVMRQLGVPDDAPHVNPNGGAIALGHPLGMSGARLVLTATEKLQRTGGRYALCTMCIGVGQGIAMVIERAHDPYSLTRAQACGTHIGGMVFR